MRIALAIAWAIAGLGATPAGAEILFARGSAVPRAVQDSQQRLAVTAQENER